MRRILICLFWVIALPVWAVEYTVQIVPNPKSATSNDYLSNPDGVISRETAAVINLLCDSIERTTTAQMAVVVLNSIGSNVPHDFGTELFNLWGVGKKPKDNGILLLVVMDQHRAEIITGYGMEADLTDAKSVRILDTYLVPHFKQKNYDKGVYEAVHYLFQYLNDPTILKDIDADSAGIASNEPAPWWFELIFFLGLLSYPTLGFYLLYRRIKNNKKIFESVDDPYQRYSKIKVSHEWWGFAFLFFPWLFLFYYIWYYTKKRKLRREPRNSPTTGKPMRLLSENEEDPYLSRGQLKEEEVKSVDYDVWVSDEKDDILVCRYDTWFTVYTNCNSCHFVTRKVTHTRTIVQPTYDSTGTGERTYSCVHCGATEKETYTIAKRTRSSSSSSGGGWSSSGGGGGSFGGGSSGGGGGGSSW